MTSESVSGAGRPAADLLAAQLSAPQSGLQPPLLSRAQMAIAALKQGRTVAAVASVSAPVLILIVAFVNGASRK